MNTVKDIFGKTRSFRRCGAGDLLGHFSKIKHWIPEAEHEEFKDRMSSCVKDGNAYVMDTGTAFLYYNPQNKYIATGVALFGKESAVDLMTLFMGVFMQVDTDTFKMDFHLHPGKFVSEYKSMLTAVSVRRNARDHRHPLVIRIDEMKEKCARLFKTRGYW